MTLIRLMFNGERRDGRLYGFYKTTWPNGRPSFRIQKVEE